MTAPVSPALHATLDHVAVVSVPAYADARIAAVRATQPLGCHAYGSPD